MSKNQNQFEILQKIENGEISASEASAFLDEIAEYGEPEPEFDELYSNRNYHQPMPEDERKKLDRAIKRFYHWKYWWAIPYGLGVLFTILGAVWLYSSWRANPFGFGFWLSWLPFVSGIIVMALSWNARFSHWLHIRIKNRKKRSKSKFSLSLPLPLNILRWLVKNFGHFLPPEVKGVDLEEMLEEMESSISSDNPLYVWVDNKEDNQQVEIWLGGGS